MHVQDVLGMSVQELLLALCDKYHPLMNSAIQEMGLLFVIDEKGKGEVQGQLLFFTARLALCGQRDKCSVCCPIGLVSVEMRKESVVRSSDDVAALRRIVLFML